MKLPFFTIKQIDGNAGLKTIEQSAYENHASLKKAMLDKGLTVQWEPTYELGDPPFLSGNHKNDSENARKIHQWLSSSKPRIPRSVLSDGRLWTALCHTTFIEYMVHRWGPKTKQEDGTEDSRVESRFFANGEGQRSLVRNGLARLYFAAEIVNGGDDYRLLPVIFEKQEIHKSFIERSLAADSNLIRAIAETCLKIKDQELNNLNIQSYAKLVNGAAGTRALDKLTSKGICKISEAVFAPGKHLNQKTSERVRKNRF